MHGGEESSGATRRLRQGVVGRAPRELVRIGRELGLPLRARSRADVRWALALRRLCAEPGRITPVFQPIVGLERGEVCAYEMLARFRMPGGEQPAAWFEAAARLGQEAPLEAAALASALRARAGLPRNCFLAINVSPAALLSERVERVLAGEHDLHGVNFELTERAVVEDYAVLNRRLEALRDRGATVAVDDTGAGYASLRHVMALRPEFVKLDRELVAHVDLDPAKAALIESIGAFASRIDAWVVAEGVECAGEAEALKRLGVPLAQGYHFGAPREQMGRARITRPRPPLPSQDVRAGLQGRLDRVAPVPRDRLESAAARFAADPHREFLPVVDHLERPIGLLGVRDSVERPFAVRPVLRVLGDEPPWTLAERAMTRSGSRRFEPLVSCDERGRYLGLLGVDMLVSILCGLARADIRKVA